MLNEGQRQISECPDVEVDHRQLVGAIEIGGGAQKTETGIVHHILRLKRELRQRVGDKLRRARLRQIERQDLGAPAPRRRDFVRKFAQLLLSPGDQ